MGKFLVEQGMYVLLVSSSDTALLLNDLCQSPDMTRCESAHIY